MARATRGLARLGIRLDRILHSPLLRAVQTADLLTPLVEDEALGGETEVTPHLAESPTESLLVDVVGDRVALVGHQPWLGELCAWLVTGSTELAERFPFPKGGVVRLEGEPRPGGMRVKDAWSPDLLRRLGK
jgi:phosphohistidine phosphatase